LIPSANRILANLQTLRFGYPAFNKIYCELQISTESEINILNKFNFKKNIIIKISKFFYNKNDKFNLNNININIVKNTKIGIIGPSGSGKSTLINIICGFIKCHNGGVKVDNESIFKNLKNWQKNIGYVPQNIVILNDTFRNNILFGLHPKSFSDESILKVLKIANLYNFYKKLPNGLNQIIKQDGINISGGEIQRIGIARALISNPKLIILDESTSALDSFTENQILKEIGAIKKTIIFVSHRLNSLEFCDKIYRVSNGKVLLFRKNKNFVKFNNK
jgi:ABC-type multidrug transport system fused ATPase/permease subunit